MENKEFDFFNTNEEQTTPPVLNEYTPETRETSSPDFEMNEFNPYVSANSYTPAPKPSNPTPKKERHPVTIGTVIAVALICSLITGIFTAGVYYTSNHFTTQQSETVTEQDDDTRTSLGNTVNITTSDSASVAEAVAAKCLPSVVGIRVTTQTTYYSWFGESQTDESYGEGTGVIISQDGYIVTNYHVISDMVTGNKGKLEVFFANDIENGIEAELIGYMVSADIAVVKINKTGLTPIELGNSDDIVMGQTVIAVGNPGGIEFIGSLSQGIISGINREIAIEGLGKMNVLQTDAAINPGNSGGALVDSSGKLIGIVSSKIVSESFEGIGFAIPVNTAKQIADGIINKTIVHKPYVGIYFSSTYDEKTLKSMGYPAGAVVEKVVEDAPAYNAGIRRADIITAVGDTKIKSVDDFNTALNKYQPGVSVKITVYRNSRYYQTSVTLGDSN